jgi:anthranilate synthase/aminodeoxychorismate synthase-like glutamine amidotransferase
MHLLIDNYDSFTYNIVQALGQLGAATRVVRNDRIDPEQATALGVESVIISPGPGRPQEAGVAVRVIRRCLGRLPILGICLGHQCLITACGGIIGRAERVMHGKTSAIYHDGQTIFRELPNPFTATRYHSLIANRDEIPAGLTVTAQTSAGEVMGVRHRNGIAEGVQFHPESILTPVGQRLLANFLAMTQATTLAQKP